ncbi:MAG: hypothetical protein M3Y59_20510 [Myxococcota bacterium]|nr:hypothetical protein [Myxococcota bacterium]
MSDPLEARFVRVAGVCALLAGASSIATLLLTAMLAGFDPAHSPYLSVSVAAGTEGGGALLRWSLVVDALGYYLMLVPLALVLHTRLARVSPSFAQLLTMAGVGSLLLGAAGAVVLAGAWPPLVDTYRAGNPVAKALAEHSYLNLSHAVYRGVWNLLVSSLHGVWVLGVGFLLGKAHPRLARFSLVLGAATLVDALAAIFFPGPIHDTVLFGYLLLTPLWCLGWGLRLVRENRVT